LFSTFFLIIIIPYLLIFFALYFCFQHADVHATACWRIGSYAPDNVQDYSVLYNNPVRYVICMGWHYTQMGNAFACPQHFVYVYCFTKWGGLGP
jgi:hypothetical protein